MKESGCSHTLAGIVSWVNPGTVLDRLNYDTQYVY